MKFWQQLLPPQAPPVLGALSGLTDILVEYGKTLTMGMSDGDQGTAWGLVLAMP
jgi:hypothetical protein